MTPDSYVGLTFGEFYRLTVTGKLGMDSLANELLQPAFKAYLGVAHASDVSWCAERAMRQSESVEEELTIQIYEEAHDAPITEVFLDDLAKKLAAKMDGLFLSKLKVSARASTADLCDKQGFAIDESRVVKALGAVTTGRRTVFKNPIDLVLKKKLIWQWVDTPANDRFEIISVEGFKGRIPYCVYFYAQDNCNDTIVIKGVARADFSKLSFRAVEQLTHVEPKTQPVIQGGP